MTTRAPVTIQTSVVNGCHSLALPASGRTVRLLPKVCLDRLPMAVHSLYTCNPLQEGHVIARAVYQLVASTITG